jgi:hypothetical protein
MTSNYLDPDIKNGISGKCGLPESRKLLSKFRNTTLPFIVDMAGLIKGKFMIDDYD